MTKTFKILGMLLILLLNCNFVFADHCTDCANSNGGRCGLCGYSCSLVDGVCIDNDSRNNTDWWSGAQSFFNGAYGYNVNSEKESLKPLNDIIELIKLIGNAVFIIVTIVLGVKYMLASSEGKADVKEGITGLVVAILLFYGWSALDEILRNSLGFFFGSGTAEDSVNRIYDLAIELLNYISVGVVIFVGVKFLFSGAEGKADLKGKGVPFVIGLVMTFGTITFLNFIIKVINDVI